MTDPLHDLAGSEWEHRVEANEICMSGEREINQAAEETLGIGNGSEAEVKEFVMETVVPISSQIDDLRALTPPEDHAE